ncbi:helicase [Maudiozyma exigua]|uniref:Peptide hydrolase n=1 Tax=Maudiozyma exigua TaxID=34358 RepID=A0A9P6WD18_MAUEX|nr:helicase [Kazachstania exigua]
MNIPKYENKPFKPPRRIGSSTGKSTGLAAINGQKRNYTNSTDSNAGSNTVVINKKRIKSHGSKILCPQRVLAPSSSSPPSSRLSSETCYTIVHRKPSQKKHKVWTGDGYAIARLKEGSKLELGKLLFYDDSGKYLGSPDLAYMKQEVDLMDNIFKVSGLEVQLDHKIVNADDRDSMMSVVRPASREKDELNSGGINATTSGMICTKSKDPEVSSANSNGKSVVPISQLISKMQRSRFKSAAKKSECLTPRNIKSSSGSTLVSNKRKYLPFYDKTQIENPIIMNSATDADVEVIVDPLLSKLLRPHQREGVKFMYDCIMSLDRDSSIEFQNETKDLTSTNVLLEKDPDINGCILADEMGLGKTLMTISLIWTLLKQTPYCHGRNINISQSGVPLEGYFKKVLIVCPVTLIINWKNEFAKWLGLNKIGVLTLPNSNTVDMDKNAVHNFLRVHRTYQVMILGYEKVLSLGDILIENNNRDNKSMASIDLLVCDEGHRLKNQSSKILNVLKEIDVKNKILLSGTPIQNDLTEFHTIIDFINPGIFGSYNYFKKHYITHISRARDTVNKYNDNIIEVGEEKSNELIRLTKKFILRRTNDILNKYLPPRTDLILFCKPNSSQLSAFRDTLNESALDFNNLTYNSSLGLITTFKKICNSPSLITIPNRTGDTMDPNDHFKGTGRTYNMISSKLTVLMKLLENIRRNCSEEKVVIVSNYTQTLDIIQDLLNSNNMISCRLDGATPPKQRSSIVSTFNRNPKIFTFLLSAKSGGVGLNLIGGSRLILFDNDWNPSIDIQAMSRIHRDGQKRHCYIYRLVTTGCIDEKILQRQLMKNSLSSKFLDGSSGDSNESKGGGKKKMKGSYNDDLFDKEDLKDLFTIVSKTTSNTHDLVCACNGNDTLINLDDVLHKEDAMETQEKENRKVLGSWSSALALKDVIQNSQKQEKQMRAEMMKKCLIGYRHINPKIHPDLHDPVATRTVQELRGAITFAFVKKGEDCKNTNVSVMLLITYITIIVFYLKNDLFHKRDLLPSDPEAIRLLDRAWLDLQNITARPHPYTSHDNDRVHDYLLNRVQHIVGNSSFCEISDDYEARRSILFPQQDVFNVSSDKHSVIYFESSNILVKIEGKDTKNKEALLLSAHYDSVPSSSGATDDGKSVVSILALLQHYSNNQPERTIVLNLNNNEEFGLLGAQAYLDRPWFKITKYFINLEGTGTGEGNAILFRTTNVETANAYKMAVTTSPFGNSVFQQGFNLRLVHSETDYKVYEGNGLWGWDIAFYKPRSLYHTVRDNTQSTSKSALWNMLSTTWQLSDYVSGTTQLEKTEDFKDPAVFFDIYSMMFFSFSAKWLFVVNILVLIILPLLYSLLIFLSRKRNVYKTTSVIGWFQFPIAVIPSTIIVKFSEQIITQQNPFIASHNFLALVLVLATEFILLNCFILCLLRTVTNQKVLKDVILFESTVLSWVSLLYCTVMLKKTNFKSTGVYPVTGLYISLSCAIIIHGLVGLFSRNTDKAHKVISRSPAISNAPVTSNSSTYGALVEPETTTESNIISPNTPPDEPVNNLDERAPLLSHVGGDSQMDSEEHEVIIFEKITKKNYEWVIQFIILIPIMFVFFQIIVDCLSGLNQTAQESTQSFDVVYNGVLVSSILLTLLVIPFISKIRFNVLVVLFICWIISSVYCVTVKSFDWNTPLKVRFVQNVNGTVELTGRIDGLKDLIFDLPSYKNKYYNHLESGVSCTEGVLGVCYYDGMVPAVLPYTEKNSTGVSKLLTVDVIDNDRLSPDRSKYAPINANIKIKVPNNRACVISFNSSDENDNISAVRKITIVNENTNHGNGAKKLIYKSNEGINELQLHKLNFTSDGYHVGIQWFPKLLWDKDLKNTQDASDSLGMSIKCFWGEYDLDIIESGKPARMIPAYDEILMYAPLNYSITNKEKGLTFTEQYIQL